MNVSSVRLPQRTFERTLCAVETSFVEHNVRVNPSFLTVQIVRTTLHHQPKLANKYSDIDNDRACGPVQEMGTTISGQKR